MWNRGKTEQAPPDLSAISDLLVISDLHMGHALRMPMGYAEIRQVVAHDREIERFLDCQASRTPEGRRWTLVLNGDTFDFMHINLPPGPDHPLELTEPEAEYGLDFDEERARFRLQMLARYHRRALRAFARFLDAGHRCVFVSGNHDVDLCFESVCRELVDYVAGHASDPAAVAERIEFAPWFYFEPGRVYIEHGHRYDPYSTFRDPLEPVEDEAPTRIDESFAHHALRVVGNRTRGLPLHDLDTWTAVDFITWGVAKGPWRLIQLIGYYLEFGVRSVGRAVGRQAVRVWRWRRRRADRRNRLAFAARPSRLPIEILQRLDALRAPPIGGSVTGVLQALYVDRIGLAALCTLVIVLGLWLGRAVETQLGVPAAVLALAVPAWGLLARLRPSPDTHPMLRPIARIIAKLTGARVIIFGHTHRPIMERIGKAHWLNSGAWVHLAHRRPHLRGERCTCGLRYAVITGRGRATRARLGRWCRRLGAPAARAMRVTSPSPNRAGPMSPEPTTEY